MPSLFVGHFFMSFQLKNIRIHLNGLFFYFNFLLKCYSTVCSKSDHVYLRHLSTEYRSILSAYMATDTRPICRPILGRDVGRHSADTSPPLGRHLTDTLPSLGQHYAHLVSSCYWVISSLLNWEGLSVAIVLFWSLTPAILMSFFQQCFFLIIASIYDPRYFRK